MSQTKLKASETLVAAYVQDGQGRRVVLAQVQRRRGFFEDSTDLGPPFVVGTTREEVRGVIAALAQLAEELPGAMVESPSDDRTKRVTHL